MTKIACYIKECHHSNRPSLGSVGNLSNLQDKEKHSFHKHYEQDESRLDPSKQKSSYPSMIVVKLIAAVIGASSI